MSRDEEAVVINRWCNWRVGRTVDNETYKDFFFEVIRNDPRLNNINVFEVLDSLVNSPN